MVPQGASRLSPPSWRPSAWLPFELLAGAVVYRRWPSMASAAAASPAELAIGEIDPPERPTSRFLAIAGALPYPRGRNRLLGRLSRRESPFRPFRPSTRLRPSFFKTGFQTLASHQRLCSRAHTRPVERWPRRRRGQRDLSGSWRPQGGPLAGQVRMDACGRPEPLRRLLLRRLRTTARRSRACDSPRAAGAHDCWVRPKAEGRSIPGGMGEAEGLGWVREGGTPPSAALKTLKRKALRRARVLSRKNRASSR